MRFDMNVSTFSPELIEKIVRCVEEAVGNDIREDIQRNDLRTTISVPTRIWDLLNGNILRSLETEDCTIAIAHRGIWQMLIIFEKTTQCIITFMREKRFSELRRRQRRRSRMHYIDMLTKQFNAELLAGQQQMTLFPHQFSDEDKLAELVQMLLHDLGGDAELVRHHVLVLFQTVDYQLSHIRAVMVTPELEIACEQNWSQYISASESTVVAKVEHPEVPENQPGRGLTLKPKAIDRQNKKLQRKTVEENKRIEIK